jgi:hypothetical protein
MRENMRNLPSRMIALSLAAGLAAQPAFAGYTSRTELAPTAATTAQQAEPQLAFGFGFYTCVGTMYRYGQRTYGSRVSDAILFQAAYETCASAY